MEDNMDKTSIVQEVEPMTIVTDDNKISAEIIYSSKRYIYPIDVKMKVHKFPDYYEKDSVGGLLGVCLYKDSLSYWTFQKDIFCYCFQQGIILNVGGYLADGECEQFYYQSPNEFKEIIMSIKADGKVHYVIDGVDHGPAFDMLNKEFYIFAGLSHGSGGFAEIS